MSRSRSPNFRRFPCQESSFDPHKVPSHPDENPHNRSHRPRPSPEDDWGFDREEMSPPSPEDRFQIEHQRRPDVEKFYHRASSPPYDARAFEGRRPSPPHGAGGDSDRRRDGFQDQRCDSRGRSPHSPPSLVRERLPARSQADPQQRAPGVGWREEQSRGPGRFRDLRDLSPATRTDNQRSGAARERGRRSLQGPNRDRQREEPHQERSPPFKRQRREMDDADHPGYRDEEEFGEQRYSVATPRDGFGGDTQGSLPRGDGRPLRPLVIEHDHGIVNVKTLPQWEQFAKRRDLAFNRQRSPRPQGSSQERFRTSDSRLEDREDVRGGRFQDHWRDSNYVESQRSPVPQDRPNTMRYGNQDGSLNPRGRGSPRPGRGRFNRGQVGRAGPLRTQPRSQQSSQGYQDLPHGEQRPGYRPFREDGNQDPMEGGPRWSGENGLRNRPRSLEQHLLRDDLDPKMPRAWSEKKTSNMAAGKEETLTIKVDMTRPINQNSSLPSYSTERQLSLDLVNVGRQRLDFLPMLEHSGTYQEKAVQTGTFAQEIITLVHQVKEQYFRDDGLTLNERFSVPQTSSFSEEETVELTLDERFSSNRGFSLNMKLLHDDDEPLFSRLESTQGLNQQLVRDPGDLRHDLERRRQERLEGVMVTIQGGGMSQRPLGQVSEPEFIDDMSPLEDVRFSTWPEEQSRRQEGNMVPRRGASFRPSSASQHRNNHFINQAGPMRRQNNRRYPEGPTR